ncbi:pyridoxal phosphate-dependent transferase [Lentinula edodes]|uniref:Pyridoxal phosphate-dependent transferase n=1 Tax=Lentinula lateritia TaxID=40482 RepID=A0A9W8ZPY8_9AGAR|nr:pyridoxal phosphate-dependent transferase [Lentinula edodes]
MSLLFKNLRIHQIFGANTNVGKTVVTTALVRASAARKQGGDTYYFKPLSTGPLEEADDLHVQQHTRRWSSNVHIDCLYRYNDPVSPHLAVQIAKASPPTTETFVSSIASRIRQGAERANGFGHMYVETAGGIHSPTPCTPNFPTQADAYRPLFLPTILVGDAKLGGISTTIAAYEALILRGYIVDALVVFNDPDETSKYGNSEYLDTYFSERGIGVAVLPHPPEKLDNEEQNRSSTEEYYDSLLLNPSLSKLLARLDTLHNCRIADLESMGERTKEHIWWPFVQHASDGGVNVIDSAYGDFFNVLDSKSLPSSNSAVLHPQLDSSASWWTQTFGHTNTRLTLAAARAAGRYGHVMFPRATHAPALALSEYLLSPNGPGHEWASRVFFSDNGSTGMEVALKMALRTFVRRREAWLMSNGSTPEGGEIDQKHRRTYERRLGVIGLKGSYHGDTIGTMDACEESGVYTCEWHDCKGYWFDPPRVVIRQGQASVEVPLGMVEELLTTDLATIPKKNAQNLITFPSPAHVYDVSSRLNTPLYKLYTTYIARKLWSLQSGLLAPGLEREGLSENRRVEPPTELAALVLEPLLLGAGGMIFVDPLFQRALVDVVRNPNQFPVSSLFSQSSSPNLQSSTIDAQAIESDLLAEPPLPHPLPIVFDEVFTGFHRLGPLTPQALLGNAHPDIAVYAKMLTGGLVPTAVTLASKEVFDAFYYAPESESPGSQVLKKLGGKQHALLHGHSYTAHAIGCEVANETVKMMPAIVGGADHVAMRDVWRCSKFEKSEQKEAQLNWKRSPSLLNFPLLGPMDNADDVVHAYSLWHPNFLSDVSQLDSVEDVMALGTVLAIRLKELGGSYTSTSAETVFSPLSQMLPPASHYTTPSKFVPGTLSAPVYSIHFRTLGNVAYFMTSLNTSLDVVREVQEQIWQILRTGL